MNHTKPAEQLVDKEEAQEFFRSICLEEVWCTF